MHTCYGKSYKVTQALLSTQKWLGRLSSRVTGYESMLRQLVLESSPRIRRLVGTVTALVSDPMDPHSVNGITVRKTRTNGPDGDGEVINIPAVFVAGKCNIAFEILIAF